MKPLGVVAAALISAALLRGRAGVKELLARLVRFRVHPGWYVFALGLPVVVAVTALGISVLSGTARRAVPASSACLSSVFRLHVFLRRRA